MLSRKRVRSSVSISSLMSIASSSESEKQEQQQQLNSNLIPYPDSSMPPPVFPTLSSSSMVMLGKPKKKHQLISIATFFSLEPNNYKNIHIPNQKLIKLGRSKTKNDVVLDKPDCSTTHCEIMINSLKDITIISIKDLSMNGVFINGKLIGSNNTAIINNNDKISFANSLHFIIKLNSDFIFSKFHEKYEIGKLLGYGHYSQVKEVTNKKTHENNLAVKIFNPTKINEKNFNRELEILRSLDHDNIVKCHEFFLEPYNLDSITTYLVLEKVNGGELFNRIIKKGKLRQDETHSILRQLLNGLKYLHSKSIVHRDLKPENILLEITPADSSSTTTPPWDQGELEVKVKIADFGLAKNLKNIQMTTTFCGTPLYVAPEILANDSSTTGYDQKCDLWSIGVLLYVCICGFPPFSDELAPPSMKQQILQGKFAFYSPYWDDIDDWILDLIIKLLVVEPTKRLDVNGALQHPWFTARFVGGYDSTSASAMDSSE